MARSRRQRLRPDLGRDPPVRLLGHHVRLLALLPWNALRLHHLNRRPSPPGPQGALRVPEHPPVQDSAPRPPLVLHDGPLLWGRHVVVLRPRGAYYSRLPSRHQGDWDPDWATFAVGLGNLSAVAGVLHYSGLYPLLDSQMGARQVELRRHPVRSPPVHCTDRLRTGLRS